MQLDLNLDKLFYKIDENELRLFFAIVKSPVVQKFFPTCRGEEFIPQYA